MALTKKQRIELEVENAAKALYDVWAFVQQHSKILEGASMGAPQRGDKRRMETKGQEGSSKSSEYPVEAPFTENYRFTGPNTAISCTIEYDKEAQRYIATGGGGGWVGFSSRSETAAALNCFNAWLLDEGGYHESMRGEPGG